MKGLILAVSITLMAHAWPRDFVIMPSEIHVDAPPLSLSLPLLRMHMSWPSGDAPMASPWQVRLSIYGKDGALLGLAKQSYPVSVSETCVRSLFNDCSLPSFDLPLSLQRISCEVQAELVALNVGRVAQSTRVRTGLCEDAPRTTGTSRADIAWVTDSFSIQDGLLSAPLINLGNLAVALPIQLVGLGLNRNGNIIWGSRDGMSTGLGMGDSETSFQFSNPIRPWQWHELCELRLITDADARVLEKNKLNNDIRVPMGLCERVPSAEEGDRADLLPLGEWVNGTFIVRIVNEGRLGVALGTPVDVFVEAFDPSGKCIYSFTRSLVGGVTGFGGSDEIAIPLLADDRVASVSLTANSNFHILESNTDNNRRLFRRSSN